MSPPPLSKSCTLNKISPSSYLSSTSHSLGSCSSFLKFVNFPAIDSANDTRQFFLQYLRNLNGSHFLNLINNQPRPILTIISISRTRSPRKLHTENESKASEMPPNILLQPHDETTPQVCDFLATDTGPVISVVRPHTSFHTYPYLF